MRRHVAGEKRSHSHDLRGREETGKSIPNDDNKNQKKKKKNPMTMKATSTERCASKEGKQRNWLKESRWNRWNGKKIDR